MVGGAEAADQAKEITPPAMEARIAALLGQVRNGVVLQLAVQQAMVTRSYCASVEWSPSAVSQGGRILYLRRAALQQVESSHFPWSSLARPQERNAATTQQCSGDTQQVAGDDSASSPC